jgi:transcriptional regulator with XRE-family HTH domain
MMLHSLNENIKRLRISQGMSQVEFAALMGVTKQCVSNWENDNVLPSIEMLVKIADIFKVKTDFLLGREPERSIDISGLTEEQAGHISLIIRDFEALNKTN